MKEKKQISEADHETVLADFKTELSKGIITPDVILKLYDNARAYDVHYSAVRSALSTFIISVGLALATVLFRMDFLNNTDASGNPVNPQLFWVALGGPGALFVLAILISAHFQRFTESCLRIEKLLEAELGSMWGKDEEVFYFRKAFTRLVTGETDNSSPNYAKAKLRWVVPADLPQWLLVGFSLAYLAFWFWWWTDLF